MSDKNGGHGGVGRRASGPSVATWRLHEWLRLNGPTHIETVLAECAQYVDPGYARRWNAVRLNQYREKRAAARDANLTLPSRAKPRVETLTPADLAGPRQTASAIRAVLLHRIRVAVRSGSLSRDETDVLTMLRMPRLPAGHTVDMLTLDPDLQRRPIIEAELVRRLRAAAKRGVFEPSAGKGQPDITKGDRAVLLEWLATWDNTDDFTDMDAARWAAVKVLLLMRQRQAAAKTPRSTSSEVAAIAALWRSLDKYA